MYPYNLNTDDHDFDNFTWPLAVLGWCFTFRWGEAMAQEAKNHAGKIGWVGVGLLLTPVWKSAQRLYKTQTIGKPLPAFSTVVEQREKINENTFVSNCNSFTNNNKLEIEQTTVNQTIKKLEKEGKLVSIYSPKKPQLLYSRLEQLQKYYPTKNLINIAIPRSKRRHFKMLHLVTKNEEMKQQVNSSNLVTKNEEMKQTVDWVNIAVSNIIETDLSTKQLIALIKPFAFTVGEEAASTYVFFVQITYYLYTVLIQLSIYLVYYSFIMKLCHRIYDLMES